MTDLVPIDDDQWPTAAEELRTSFATRLNVYRTMAHHPRLLKSWAPLRDHVVVHNALGRQYSEIVILRAGHRMNAPYEWAHHVSRGRACGLSDERISSIAGGLDGMEENDRTLARAVDEIMQEGRMSPTSRDAVIDLVGIEGLFDVMATVGFYTTLAFIVNSCDTPIDHDVAAELEARPLGSA